MPFLQTKLFIPPTSPNLVSRPHLLEKLFKGTAAKLILVSAPAGYGKSTLISQWVSSNRPVAWVSLDENDNNLKRFLAYLITAFQQVESSIGDNILSSLESMDNPPLESILNILINEISESEKKFLVVLDDYHLISKQIIHDGIDYFLDHLPPNAQVIISGRVDPPISLSRFRGRGQMVEIRQNDLRFTEKELELFLTDIKGLNLSQEQIALLITRTEGWITGLQLAAISMQGREDINEFVTTFSGSNHYIIDYLVDEVMSHQSKEIQDFLCQTSILNRFNASLCDTVLEISNSKKILQDLNNAHLFLIPLDDERNWYRYHHLFSDFLNQRLHENESEIISGLHNRASVWLQEDQQTSEAIGHSLLGEDFQRAAQLVEKIGPDMMMHSEFDQLEKWLDAIPINLVENWPWLCVIRAWMYDRWAQFEIGEDYLQHAETALENTVSLTSDEDENIIRGQVAAIRALYALKKGLIPQSIEHSNQALNYLPKGYFNRGVALFSLGWAKKILGDLPGAIQELQKGYRASLAAGNMILAQVIILDIGKTQFLQGHLFQAAATLREAIQIRYEKSGIKIPYAAAASISLADILREWNELDAAMVQLQEGIEIGIPSKLMDVVTIGYASMVLVYLAKENFEKASHVCEKAKRMVRDIPDLEQDSKIRAMSSRVRCLLKQNKLTDATRYMQENGLKADDEIDYFTIFKYKILARVLVYLGRQDSATQELIDAHKILAKIIELAEPAGYISLIIEALVLQSLAYQTQDMKEFALKSMKEALKLAEPEGFVRTFIDEGEPMQKLLRQVFSAGFAKNYVGKLLSEFNKGASSRHANASQPFIEPLSTRELDVLKLLCTELSGPEIARELMVSLNTIRTHTKNIYTKLGVNNRRTAVNQAKDLNLI